MGVKKLPILLLMALVLSVCAQVYAGIATLGGLRVSSTSQQSRFVFELSKPIYYHEFSLHGPERLVIDLRSTKLGTKFDHKTWRHTPLLNLRSSTSAKDQLRLVFDLPSGTRTKVFTLKAHDGKPYRLVVDLHSAVQSQLTPAKSPVPTPPKTQKPKPTVIKKVSRKPRDIIVVIDPGHGGKDPGATGARGTHEKDVVLTISKQLQQRINQEQGFKAILTRNADYYLSLRRRLNLAHQYKADMFVAIHADAYRHNRAHGASVYALSERGATSEAARWLAKRENESEFVGGLELADKDHLLREVLIDLSQTHTIGASLQMGTNVLHQMSKFTTLHHPSVEQAAFVVLKSPDIPSLLVETGFLSNPKEESKLTSKSYQNKLVNAIAEGIKSYFITHPPLNTKVAV